MCPIKIKIKSISCNGRTFTNFEHSFYLKRGKEDLFQPATDPDIEISVSDSRIEVKNLKENTMLINGTTHTLYKSNTDKKVEIKLIALESTQLTAKWHVEIKRSHYLLWIIGIAIGIMLIGISLYAGMSSSSTTPPANKHKAISQKGKVSLDTASLKDLEKHMIRLANAFTDASNDFNNSVEIDQIKGAFKDPAKDTIEVIVNCITNQKATYTVNDYIQNHLKKHRKKIEFAKIDFQNMQVTDNAMNTGQAKTKQIYSCGSYQDETNKIIHFEFYYENGKIRNNSFKFLKIEAKGCEQVKNFLKINLNQA